MRIHGKLTSTQPLKVSAIHSLLHTAIHSIAAAIHVAGATVQITAAAIHSVVAVQATTVFGVALAAVVLNHCSVLGKVFAKGS
ncbi:conserved hypothetical protein [Ricinus communis]|uniref:Uncharacterized protein n=1 Tax=Ricinus communis TaxID=3988 RepID=B9RDI0_RICCO|nr:conserved hypothetical protein [Ricinus communis]